MKGKNCMPCPFCGEMPQSDSISMENDEFGRTEFNVLGCINRSCLVVPVITGRDMDELRAWWNAAAAPMTNVKV